MLIMILQKYYFFEFDAKHNWNWIKLEYN